MTTRRLRKPNRIRPINRLIRELSRLKPHNTILIICLINIKRASIKRRQIIQIEIPLLIISRILEIVTWVGFIDRVEADDVIVVGKVLGNVVPVSHEFVLELVGVAVEGLERGHGFGGRVVSSELPLLTVCDERVSISIHRIVITSLD